MKKSVLFLVLAFISLPASASDFADAYGDVAGLFGIDAARSTGLTAFPVLTIPVGGRYEGLGTAYTAVSRDTGFFDANPAASSSIERTELALQHTNLIADANMESIAYTSRFTNFGFGAAGKFLHVPFTEYDALGDQVNTIRYTESVAGVNASYRFLSSFYSYGLAVGTNVKTAYRHIPAAIEPGQSAFAYMADFGLLTRFNFLKFYSSRERNFSVGLTARNVGPPVLDDPLPTSINAGIAYAPLRPVEFSFDLQVPIQPFTDLPTEPMAYAGGISASITRFFGLHSGFLLKGGNPRSTIGGVLDFENTRFVANYTLDMTTQVGTVDRFSVEAAFKFGDRGRAERAEQAEEYYLQALLAFADGELERTVTLTERALEIDAGFTPAEETLRTAERSLAMQRRLEQIQLDETIPAPDFDEGFEDSPLPDGGAPDESNETNT